MTTETAMSNARYGQWALITGASEGIGKGFAQACARQGYDLVMIARRQPLLDETANEIANTYGVKTRTLSLDLTADDAVERIQAFCEPLEVGLLINNAAFAFPAEFLSMKPSAIRKQVNINVELVALLSHHFGALMKARGRGGIINVSSKTGEVPMPYFAMYSATKAFISTLSESLWFELKDHGITLTQLSTYLHDGYTQTLATNDREYTTLLFLPSRDNVSSVSSTFEETLEMIRPPQIDCNHKCSPFCCKGSSLWLVNTCCPSHKE